MPSVICQIFTQKIEEEKKKQDFQTLKGNKKHRKGRKMPSEEIEII